MMLMHTPLKKQPRRLRIAVSIASVIFSLSGAALLIVSIFATFLGLDHDPSWGTGRTLLAALGVGFCFIALAVRFYSVTASLLQAGYNFSRRLTMRVVDSEIARRFQPSLRNQKASTFFQERDSVFAWSGAILCVLIALWFITAGRMLVWTTTTHYFDQQADAFLAGQLALLEQPSTGLLEMDNPYDWQARIDQQISHLWDVSLYEGRYYLYWGPVPALLAAVLKSVISTPIDDSVLVFLLYCGVVLFLTLLLLLIVRRRIYPRLPAWLLLPMVMFGGLSAPMLWLINRPSVYEVAIAGGQFFLVIGLFASLWAVFMKKSAGLGLMIAGFAWGAAIGCRLNLAPAVGFFVLALGVYWLKTRPIKHSLVIFGMLITPLLLWAFGLGWYNFARFGSIMETGHRYQLTGPALPVQYNNVASIRYVLPSLYSYLIRTPLFLPGEFPFFYVKYVKETMWPFFIHLPEHYYYSEPVAGLLTVTPVTWLLALPAMGSIGKFWHWLNMETSQKIDPASEVSLTWIMLAGGSVFLFAFLLVFISTSLRYLADVIPILTLLTALCVGWGLAFLEKWPVVRLGLFVLVFLLLAISVLIGLLSSFTAGDVPFAIRNPSLFFRLQNFFQ